MSVARFGSELGERGGASTIFWRGGSISMLSKWFLRLAGRTSSTGCFWIIKTSSYIGFAHSFAMGAALGRRDSAGNETNTMYNSTQTDPYNETFVEITSHFNCSLSVLYTYLQSQDQLNKNT